MVTSQAEHRLTILLGLTLPAVAQFPGPAQAGMNRSEPLAEPRLLLVHLGP